MRKQTNLIHMTTSAVYPSPAAAGVIASFPIGLQEIRAVAIEPELPKQSGLAFGRSYGDISISVLALLLPIITICVALLMVSRVRYPHVVNQFLRGSGNRTKLLKIVFSLFWYSSSEKWRYPYCSAISLLLHL